MSVTSLHPRLKVDGTLIRRAAIATMRRESCPASTEVSVALVDDDTIRTLNRQYLGKGVPTDVLAFPMGRAGGMLGDVVISLDRAREQAREYGHHVEREVALLVIHGVLHLLGYKDRTRRDAARIAQRQQEILTRLLDGPPA